MATTGKFKELKDFKKFLLSKEKFDLEDFWKLFSLYIDSIWYYHFKNKLKWIKSDEDIDVKLQGVFEMYSSMKIIIDEDNQKKS